MPKDRISKRSVDAFECPAGKPRDILWDTAITGFACIAFKNGKKTFIAQWRDHGRLRRAHLGQYGALTPDQARAEAQKLLGKVAAGADPIGDRAAARHAQPFRVIAEEYLKDLAALKRAPSTIAEYRRLLEASIYPCIGNIKMVELRRVDVHELHRGLSKSPYIANKCVAVISAVWNWHAKLHSLPATSNPCAITKNPETHRIRILSPAELERLGEALATSTANPSAIAAIRLLLLTGCRLNEILHAKHEYIDFERHVLNLPTSKTGAREVYLNDAAIEILASIEKVKDSPYLFHGTRPGLPLHDIKKPWRAVIAAAGLEGLRIHDLRHAHASVGAAAGLSLPIIGKLLGHSQPATTARYAHLAADPIHAAANQIGEKISAAMNRNRSDPAPAGNVVKLKRKDRQAG